MAPRSPFANLLFSACLVASAAFPLWGTTWIPDPSLTNPDRHRRLYEIARTYCDANFDPDANMVGVQSKNPPNKKSHSTRESAYYAYGLLLSGDLADRTRAQAILRGVVAAQYTGTDPGLRGAFNWVAEDKQPQDLNSAAFVGLTLADVISLDRRQPCLDPDIRILVEQAGRLSVEAVLHRDVEAGYTNIAFLSIALAAAGEKLWSMPGAGAWSEAKLDAVLALAGDGEFAEYLSPTYAAVSLHGAYAALKYSFSDTFNAKAGKAVDHLWKQIAASYHPPTFQLAGPHLRSYGDDMLLYAAGLKYFLLLALPDGYPLPEGQNDHDWDFAGLFTVTDMPITVRPEFATPSVTLREWTAVGSGQTPVRHLSQYKDSLFTLGTVAFQDEWKQKRNLVAYWRNEASPGVAVPGNVRVGYCIDESNETITGFPGAKVNFYSRQDKGTALVALIAPASAPVQGTASLVFDPGAAPADGETSPYRIIDGSVTTYLYPVSPSAALFTGQADGKTFRMNRPWTAADTVGNHKVLSYLVVFRRADQPAPKVSGLALKTDGNDITAEANVDGLPLSVSFKN